MPHSGQQSFYITNATADTDAVRHEVFQGIDHLVVPIVALVEGVLHPGNSPIEELALAEEFGKFPASWNGRPVTLDHPVRNGSPVSVSQSPKVFEEETLGFLFNTSLDSKKLKTEAWINMDSVRAAGGNVEKEIKRLEEGGTVEVSTGLFVELEQKSGKFNGEKFDGIWRNIAPDHLAILPEGTIGACSVADGCGAPRLNCAGKENCSCGCTRSNEMPKGKKKEPENEEDLKDNQEEGIQNEPPQQDPPEETDSEKLSSERTSFLKGLQEKFAGVFRLHKSNEDELSDTDVREMLRASLRAEKENPDGWYDVVAVFKNNFVYSPNWGTLYRREYSISSKEEVRLGSDMVRVRPETTFVPINLKEDVKMDKQALVNSLITNATTKWAEDDREFLSTLSEEQLDKMQPTANAEPPQEEPKENQEGEEEPKANAVPTVDEYIAQAPTELQEVLNEGIRMQRDRKTKLVAELKDNKRNKFSETELKAMSLLMLEKLAELGNTPNFEGRQGSPVTTNASDQQEVPTPPSLFPIQKTA